MRVLLSFQVLEWLCNTPFGFNTSVMEPKGFFIYPKKGIAYMDWVVILGMNNTLPIA
jgi:hypothetical protein